MFGLGAQELMIILVIALVLFGGNKLPELARSLGKSMNEFKKGINESTTGDEAKAESKTEAKADATTDPKSGEVKKS
jgi:sec-independent protein translocase protein TatA